MIFSIEIGEFNFKVEPFISEHKKCDNTAMGGKFTYSFTPTGLGTIKEIKCNSCGTTLQLTDSVDW